MTRILTLQVEITDHGRAQWIWDNHMGENTDNGINVLVIHEGKIPECSLWGEINE